MKASVVLLPNLGAVKVAGLGLDRTTSCHIFLVMLDNGGERSQLATLERLPSLAPGAGKGATVTCQWTV